MQPLLAEIAEALVRHAPREGLTATDAPGVAVIRADAPTPMQSGVVSPSVCVVVQGSKWTQPGEGAALRYGAGNYLASSIAMPVAGRVTVATRARPYLALQFALTSEDVLAVVADVGLDLSEPPRDTPVAFVGTSDVGLLEVVLRSARSLADPRAARGLAAAHRRELVFRLLTGPHAAAVWRSAMLARIDDGVGRAVAWIAAHYRERIDVAELAKHAHMATSTLHRKFKAAVLMGPLQYQKRLRLEEARRLLLAGRTDATRAAYQVGYQSPSQFSREYGRQFGLPPRRDATRERAG